MSLRQRSQTARLSREKFIRLVARLFPPIRYTRYHITATTPKTFEF
jgi:hypothetical protein